MILLLLAVVLVCTLIGYLVGNPTAGLLVGGLLAVVLAFANSSPHGL
jgi:mannose/fructose/N-acetylgalactosamine-specific phosphotransferase system component IIC